MKTIMLFALVAFALGLAGCNTIQGMGKDVSATGDWDYSRAKRMAGTIRTRGWRRPSWT